jgi:hypothetical protein
MNAAPGGSVTRDRTHGAVVVEDPRIVVVESPGSADSGAALDALELIVKWAVRSHRRCNASVDDAAAIPEFTAFSAGEST